MKWSELHLGLRCGSNGKEKRGKRSSYFTNQRLRCFYFSTRVSNGLHHLCGDKINKHWNLVILFSLNFLKKILKKKKKTNQTKTNKQKKNHQPRLLSTCDSPASVSQVQGTQACATMPRWLALFNFIWLETHITSDTGF